MLEHYFRYPRVLRRLRCGVVSMAAAGNPNARTSCGLYNKAGYEAQHRNASLCTEIGNATASTLLRLQLSINWYQSKKSGSERQMESKIG